ncbi:MAG: type II toxin-antitoxin system RelE/ParE family toxin [Saprospiraceae bacterium]|nr:type II toxin-antitoxin system RelE/ParE family toxin [Saprospiraceae bacterium]MCB9326728.1 type II toxin-antitoxin system RelE/ParE family toxin [Lewinellaceae bacterium]
MKLRFTANALRRITQISDYYNDTGNPKKGRHITRQILARSEELEEYPELGPEEENLREVESGHRSLFVGAAYKIIYLIATPFIIITDIFDTRQDPNKMKS